jgi:HK97 family phage major capsid protein
LMAVHQAAQEGSSTDPRLLEVHKLSAAAIGLGENVPADGGFLVQEDFVTALIRRTYQFGAILSRVRRIPLSAASNALKINAVDETSRVTGSRWGGIRAYWADEGDTLTASQPRFRQMRLEAHKLIGLVYATDEMMADVAALGSIVSQAFSEEFSFFAEDAIMNGDGAGKPLGFLTAGALVSQAKEAGQAADTVVAANLFNMWSRAWARGRPDSVWLINQNVEPQLFGLTLGDHGIYFPAGTYANSSGFGSLFGRPVIPVEYAATLGDAGDISLVDLSQYIWVDKGTPQAASSIHVRFINDEMTFRFTWRVDGQPAWNSALTPFQGTLTLSPYVSLAERA